LQARHIFCAAAFASALSISAYTYCTYLLQALKSLRVAALPTSTALFRLRYFLVTRLCYGCIIKFLQAVQVLGITAFASGLSHYYIFVDLTGTKVL
jgi:hypothetical protein